MQRSAVCVRLAKLAKLLAAPTYVHSCVQYNTLRNNFIDLRRRNSLLARLQDRDNGRLRFKSLEQTRSTLASNSGVRTLRSSYHVVGDCY